MSTSLMPEPRQRYYTNIGTPAAFCKLYTYAAGTTTPKKTYTDSAGTVEHANPIILDAKGEALIYWTGAYKVDLKTAAGVQVTGYPVDNVTSYDALIAASDTLLRADLAASTGAGLSGWIRNAVAAIATTVAKWMERQRSSVFDFMTDAQIADTQLATPTLDHTAAILAYKTHALLYLPFTMRFPKGTFVYTDIGNFAYAGLRIIGEGHRETILKCTTNIAAFTADAFKPGLTGDDATAPYVKMDVCDITFQGANGAPKILDLQGLARCAWSNVFTRNADSVAGIAVHMRGCQLNTFYNIGCSTDLDTMTSVPYGGLLMDAGTRDGVNVGNSSNNSFKNPYFEGSQIGIQLSGADQNIFTSGSAESSGVYDLLVGATSKYNAFIGVGFESTTVTANVGDAGVNTKFINCYANKKVFIQGRNGEISGGFYQRIEVQAGAVKNRVADVTVKNWETSFPGTGGYFDSGTASEWKNIYDIAAAAYTYPLAGRTNLVVGASPFTWVNTTGQYVEVLLQTGTVTQVRQLRVGDGWLKPIVIPGAHLLPPSDSIEVSYSVIPSMSYVPHNGFQG